MFDYLENSMSFISGQAPGFDGVSSAVNIVANVIIIIAFGLSTSAFAFSLIQFTLSKGDPKALEKPKNALTWSIVGMVLSFVVFGLKNLLIRLLGFDTEIFF